VQPKPLYKRIGFRELVKIRDERVARQKRAAEQQAAAKATTPQ